MDIPITHCEIKLEMIDLDEYQTADPTRETPNINFTEKWNRSDVAIKTDDSEQLLYANKHVLAIHSPFFEAMFFTGFSESDKEVITLNGIDYKVLLEILRILHHVGRSCQFYSLLNCLLVKQEEMKIYTAKAIQALHTAGDQFDIPLIRDMCRAHLSQSHTKAAFLLALSLGYQNEKSKILKRLPFKDIEEFIQSGTKDIVFSPSDAEIILLKFKEFERRRQIPGSPNFPDQEFRGRNFDPFLASHRRI